MLMDDAETDVPGHCISLPGEHRAKRHSNNPLERVNKEIKRRSNAVGILPSHRAARRRYPYRTERRADRRPQVT